MREIDEVMHRIRENPAELYVPENIDAIIRYQREARLRFESGAKPEKTGVGKKSAKELLSLVIKSKPNEPRRA